jgi:predicted enzyme related to lactoylglutathione lyase
VREVNGDVAYVEFRVGDYEHELGIITRRFAAPGQTGTAAGAVVYWQVDDVQASFERLLAMGASAHEQPVERGPGFVTASVIDPFGNVLGARPPAAGGPKAEFSGPTRTPPGAVRGLCSPCFAPTSSAHGHGHQATRSAG